MSSPIRLYPFPNAKAPPTQSPVAPAPSAAELADLALAVALAEETDGVSGKQEFVAHTPPLEFFKAGPMLQSDSVSGPGSSYSATTSTPRDDERLFSEQQNPWEDAVDEVFASVFK